MQRRSIFPEVTALEFCGYDDFNLFKPKVACLVTTSSKILSNGSLGKSSYL